MIATHAINASRFVIKEMPLFLERPSSKTRYAKDNSKRHDTSKKIVPIEEIVYIEGTVSVAF